MAGQARVPTPKEEQHLFDVIQQHRYPEKNTAIMRISFCLGLRVQEIALLELKEVCRLGPERKTVPRKFKLHQVLHLPKGYTKGADAMNRSKKKYERKTVSFSVERFNQILEQVEALAKVDAPIDPTKFYPPLKHHEGKGRDLPMVSEALREALENYLAVRLKNDISAKPTDRLFITQKGGSYSPNTLQDHMTLMLKGWAGIEKTSSHSGRRSLLTNVIHSQGGSIKTAQKIAGHKSAATTIIYDEPPESEIVDALKNKWTTVTLDGPRPGIVLLSNTLNLLHSSQLMLSPVI